MVMARKVQIKQSVKRPQKLMDYYQPYLFVELASQTRKEEFLKKLRGRGQRYKRYLGSPLRYAGGKSWAVGYVLEYIPDDIQRLVSLFLEVVQLKFL